MNTIEKIRAEIERRIDILTHVYARLCEKNDEEMCTYYHGKVVALEELLPFFDTLGREQPEIEQLPSNLDEAANDGWALYEYRESPKGLYSTCYIDGFKAGAEWMAGQGVTKETVL